MPIRLQNKHYEVRQGALTVYQLSSGIHTEFHNLLPGCSIFSDSEIIAETDGLLKVLKSFYPKDGKHFFYVRREDLI